MNPKLNIYVYVISLWIKWCMFFCYLWQSWITELTYRAEAACESGEEDLSLCSFPEEKVRTASGWEQEAHSWQRMSLKFLQFAEVSRICYLFLTLSIFYAFLSFLFLALSSFHLFNLLFIIFLPRKDPSKR